MPRIRRITCPSCDASWDRSAARFCGRCGNPLKDPGPRRRRRRPVLLRGIVAATSSLALLTVLAAVTRVELVRGDPRAALSDEVELPELRPLAELNPEQHEALERFDPEQLRCEPAGCEAWRLTLEVGAHASAVSERWLVVLDGTTLRIRARAPVGHDGALAAAATIGAPADPVARDLVDDPTSRAPERPPDLGVSEVRPQARTWGSPVDTSRFTAGLVLSRRPFERGIRTEGAPRRVGNYDLSSVLDALEQDPTDPPRHLAVSDDGALVLQWSRRVALVSPDGELRWSLPREGRVFRYVAIVDDRVLVLSDDLAWPEGTVGPAATTDPIVVSTHALEDGGEFWRREAVALRDMVAGGLLVTTGTGAVELLELEDGAVRWRREPSPSYRLQTTAAPWVVLASPEEVRLLDPQTGDDLAVRDGAALLSPAQRIGDVWIAVWRDAAEPRGAPPQVALLGLDEVGEERWRVPLTSLSGGRGRCCPTALPWVDGTVAVFDPAATAAAPWLTVEPTTGQLRQLPFEQRPRLPFALADAERIHVPAFGNGRLLQEGPGRIGVLAAEGTATVLGGAQMEVLSVDPLVIVQGRQLLGIEVVPGRHQ